MKAHELLPPAPSAVHPSLIVSRSSSVLLLVCLCGCAKGALDNPVESSIDQSPDDMTKESVLSSAV